MVVFVGKLLDGSYSLVFFSVLCLFGGISCFLILTESGDCKRDKKEDGLEKLQCYFYFTDFILSTKLKRDDVHT